MSAPKNEMYYSLLEWFKTLNLNAPHADAESLADGVALAQVTIYTYIVHQYLIAPLFTGP